MLVVTRHRKLILETPRAAEVQAAIPHAVLFASGGKQLIAVPHAEDEIRVLKNLGFANPPPPIDSYYDWPGRFPPMSHQKDTSAFLVAHMRALCLNAPGTGKTISTLWAADYLLEQGVVNRVLVIAPLSTLVPVWGKELTHHLPHRKFEIITGARKSREKKVARVDVGGFAIINHDGFSTEPKLFADFDLIVYDEVTALKTPGSQRYKKFALFMKEFTPRLWMLTGTPISQNPTDAWTLSRLVDSPRTPRGFNAFRDMVMKRVTTFKWVPRPEALDICKTVLQPSIRFALDECKDLPQTVYITRDCELTPQQAAAYKTLQAEALLSLGGSTISAANAAVLFSKLLQLCCGVVYDEDGEAVVLDSKSRTDTLDEILDEIGDKCIIFAPLRSVQNFLEEHLKARGHSVGVVHGSVTKGARDEIFHKFQTSDEPKILLAHPKVAAHGLTLTRASSIIWYAPIHSLEMYEQANARIRRITTEGKTTVFHIAATGFERELYRRLAAKQQTLADFLTLVRGYNE